MKWDWIGLGMGVIYGILTIAACMGQIKEKKISLSASILMILAGALMIVSCFYHRTFFGMATLISCFIALQFLAITNGIQMYGRINVKHHVFRLFSGAGIIFLLFF